MKAIFLLFKTPRILLSFATLLAAAAVIIGATFAFFSDTETSTGNTLEAGALDLQIDNTSFYNGVLNQDTTWDLDDLTDQLFFDFQDIKPSDFGEDTMSFHVDNDSWVCAEFTLTANDDNTCMEPELLDDATCTDPDPPGNSNSFDGELAQNINFIFWADDGNNVLEDDEQVILEASGSAQSIFDNNIVPLADSNINNLGGLLGDPMEGGATHYIGKAWCFGTLGQAPLPASAYSGPDNPSNDGVNPQGPVTPEDGGITCNGSSLNNATQTDKVLADIQFSAVQARNNPGFVCEGEPTITPTITPTPTQTACQQADVMLVLDRSGSINSTELSDLKTAAKDFVDSLGLTPTGIHAGKSSFATTGSLNHHLSDDPTSVKAAIDAMVAGGFTNLKEGIDLAKTEMDTPGDLHDRPDITSPDKMIIITDGNPNRPLPSSTADDVAAASATSFKSGGGEVFVVGVGSDVNQAYLEGIATDASHYYSVAGGYGGLQTALAALDLCD